MESEFKSDLLSTKTNWALKRLNVAFSITIVLGSFNLVTEFLTKPLLSNIPYKLLLFVIYGGFLSINKSINQNINLVKYVSFIVGEILNLLLIYFAFVEEPSLGLIYIQLASFVIIFYQGYLLMSVQSLILFSIKHTMEWTLAGLYFSQGPITNFASFLSGVFALPIFMFACLYFNYLQDVDLCKSRKFLQYSSDKIEYLVESISDRIYILDKTLNIMFTNSASKASLQGHSFSDFVSILRYKINYLDEVDSELISDIRGLFRCPMGTETALGITEYESVFIEWSGKIVIWENQVAMILIGKNVTRVIQLEKVKLESQYKSTLLSTVSHELRTPTNALISMAQLVQESGQLCKKNLERMDLIKSSCSYLLCLINDLLDYSQIMVGCLKISRIQIDLKNLLEECKKLLEIQLIGGTIEIKLNYLTPIPENLVTDPYRVKQIVLNLLSNAKKFTIKGVISLSVQYENGKLSISCEDSGIGISPDNIEKLFQQFAKLDVPSLNPQGVGLGLYISNMLTYELGGEGIKVKSDLGKGSVFSFYIQVSISEVSISAEDIPDEDAKVSLPRIGYKGKKNVKEILIVDDTQFNILAYTQILESEGYKCSFAINGEEAIEMIKRVEFFIILMDCEMPVLDGWETTKLLKKMESKGEIKKLPPILGCTAHSSEVALYRCQEAGMIDLIIKPCPKDVILSRIHEFL